MEVQVSDRQMEAINHLVANGGKEVEGKIDGRVVRALLNRDLVAEHETARGGCFIKLTAAGKKIAKTAGKPAAKKAKAVTKKIKKAKAVTKKIKKAKRK